ncbi:MAG: hypothetical protein OXG78_06700 [Chloroflexi bacterium]|nr:hypothetical protein [Chloroflexota bacterium]
MGSTIGQQREQNALGQTVAGKLREVHRHIGTSTSGLVGLGEAVGNLGCAAPGD